MPPVTKEQFETLNLMAGTAKSLDSQPLSDDDIAIWQRDFNLLCSNLSRLVDPELGQDLASERPFYDETLKVAKGYFDKKPFGGLKAATGQFGFRLIIPQDLKQAASAVTPAFYSWVQTVTTVSARTIDQYTFGYSSGNVYTCNAANQGEILAWHRLISYKPAPKIIAVEFWINDAPYMPYSVEPFSKISKNDKLFKIIPMPGKVILHPGGGFYMHTYFDLQTGATAPSGTTNVDIEVGLFGLCFGEYDYLKASATTLV